MSWDSLTLGELIALEYGRSLHEAARRGGQVPVYGSNGQVGTHDVPLVEGPGIIVGRKGSVGAVAFSDSNFWPIDTTYYVVRKRNDDWWFLYFLLLHNDLSTLNTHSAVPGLNRESVYTVPVRTPELPIQRAIAAILRRVSRAIDIQEQLIATVREVKQAAMQQLFARGLRGERQKETEIGLVPESWRVDRLEKMVQFQRGFDITKKEQRAGSVPVVSSGGVRSTHSTAAAHGPGVIIGRKGSIGTIHFIEQDYWPHDTTLWSTDFHGNDPRFVYYRLHMMDFKKLDSGAANPALNRNFVHSEIVSWPTTLDEQCESAHALHAIDRKLAHHERKCATLQDLFKTLLNELMTGRLRTDDDIEVDLVGNEPALAPPAQV